MNTINHCFYNIELLSSAIDKIAELVEPRYSFSSCFELMDSGTAPPNGSMNPKDIDDRSGNITHASFLAAHPKPVSRALSSGKALEQRIQSSKKLQTTQIWRSKFPRTIFF